MTPGLPMKTFLSATFLAGAFAVALPLTLAFAPGAAQAQDDAAADTTEPAIDTSTIEEMVLGSPDAPVTMIEYASFTCPHCAAFHGDQFQRLKEEYIDTGKVQFIYREVYFDRFGLWASMVARCGGEMRFFGISSMLYEQQQEWIAGGDPTLISENLRRIGRTAGMDDATIDACMQDETMAQTLVAWFQENAARDGVEATPTLFIDGVKHTNMPYEELSALIETALAD
jgi:protein-disulfide isomerase